jgi:uncharacterized protein YeeX (DUF496 family)
MSSANPVILHPEAEQRQKQLQALKDELAKLVCDRDQLVNTVIPNLEADYQLKIGRYMLENFSIGCECRALKRELELIQMARNHQQVPDFKNIGDIIRLEFEKWQRDIEEMARKVQAAQSRMNHLMTAEESQTVQKLYRDLAKALHPDINPNQSETDKALWFQVQAAYQQGNMVELETLSVLVLQGKASDPVSLPVAIEEWQKAMAAVQSHLHRVLKQLADMKVAFPMNHLADLQNEAWVFQEQRNLQDIKASLNIQREYGDE